LHGHRVVGWVQCHYFKNGTANHLDILGFNREYIGTI
jgi:hypothetical protein